MAVWAGPGRSWSFYRTMVGGTAYDVLGPLPEGAVVVAYRCDYHLAAAAASIQQGMSLGTSWQGNADSLGTGIPLLDRSSSVAFAVPSWGVVAGAELVHSMMIYVGRVVRSGSRYVIVGTTAGGAIQFTGSIEVAELQKLRVEKEA